MWEPEAEWETVLLRKRDLRQRLGLDREERHRPVNRTGIEQSGLFRSVRELALHNVEVGDGERLLGFALSEGSMTTLLASDVTEEEVGLDRLRRVAATMPDPVHGGFRTRYWSRWPDRRPLGQGPERCRTLGLPCANDQDAVLHRDQHRRLHR
jgi:hypothetical protein